jgi:hypothetical protein
MPSPKRRILELVGEERYPLSKADLVALLDAAGSDADVLLAAAVLDPAEFPDRRTLGRCLDEAFGMPSAFTQTSALEHEPVAAPPADDAADDAADELDDGDLWVTDGDDLTVRRLRSLLDQFAPDAIVSAVLEGPEDDEPLVPIAVYADSRTGGLVVSMTRLNSG